MKIVTRINGREVDQHLVDSWERKRIAAVGKKLDAPIDVSASNLDMRSAELARFKQSLGYETLYQRLRTEMKLSALSAVLMNAFSFGRRKVCVTEIVGTGLSAAEVDKGIEALMLEPSEEHDAVNLGACPDHYALRQLDNGRLEVIETTGGAPFPIQFLIDFGLEEGLSIPRDNSYPYQSVGVAKLSSGAIIGGVRHQFRDEGKGFKARLAVELPLVTPNYFIRQHQMHLACEWGRWFRWLYIQKIAAPTA